MDVVIWRIALHVLVELGVVGVAPLLVLVDGERYRFVEHGGEGVDKRNLRHSAGEKLGARIDDRADEQTPRAPATDGELPRIRVAAVDELDRARDEVIERVGLVQELAVLVPLPANLSPTSDVGDRENETAVEQAEPRCVEHGIAGQLVGAIAVEQGRIRTARL